MPQPHRRAPDGRARPPTRCSRSTTRATARSRRGSGPGTVLDVGCGVGDETARLAGAGPPRARRRLRRRHRGRRHRARSRRRGPALRGAWTARTSACATAPSTGWCRRTSSSTSRTPSCTSPSSRVCCTTGGTAFVITPNRAGRLREPVPRLPVRGRRARVAARDCSSTTSRCSGSRATRAARRLRPPARQRREAAAARPARACVRQVPRSWYVYGYKHVLPVVYKMLGLVAHRASARASTRRTSSSATPSHPPPRASSPSPAPPRLTTPPSITNRRRSAPIAGLLRRRFGVVGGRGWW